MLKHVEVFIPATRLFIQCVEKIKIKDLTAFHENYNKLKEITSFDEGYCAMQKNFLLIHAISSNNKEIITFLLNDGLDCNLDCNNEFALRITKPVLLGAIAAAKEDMLKFLINDIKYNIKFQDDKGKTLIHYAASLKNIELISFLLQHQYFSKADIDIQDDKGRTPLWIAAKQGHAAVVKFLVAQGCNIDTVDNQGKTLSLIAAQQGHLDIVNYLHEKKSIIEIKEININLLYLAIKQGNLKETRRLIKLGNIDLNINNSDNENFLWIAASNGHLDLVEFLLARGARMQFKKFFDDFFEEFIKKDNKQQLAISKSDKYKRIIELLMLVEHEPFEELSVYNKFILHVAYHKLIFSLADHASNAKDPKWRSAYQLLRKLKNQDSHKDNMNTAKI